MLKLVKSTDALVDKRRIYSVTFRLAIGARQLPVLLVMLLLATSALVAYLTKYTYDSGDSIYHYLFAHFAPQHPENLLNAWAKPLFTLLAVLPSQAGFLGMKLFQCALVALSAWLAYTTARALRLPWPALAILFCYACPDYFRVQFSGLTEPLFGLILVGAVALAVTNRPNWSAALITWLPFVRSEGFLLLGIWFVYLVWNRNWRALPLLFLGYAAYSVVGGFILGDFGWVFTNNPYALHSQYGSGSWLRFLEHLPTLLGWVVLGLFVVGGLRMLTRVFSLAEWSRSLFRAELFLIYGSVVVFVAAHSIFWALGLFGSFGMTRVLTVLTPLFAVAALSGLAWITQAVPTAKARRWVATGVVALTVGLLFGSDHGYTNEEGMLVGHHSNLHWRRDFQLNPDLVLAHTAAAWMNKNQPGWRWHPVAFEHIYYSVALDVDLFDLKVRPLLTREWRPDLDALPMGTYVFWDGWFCPVEGRLPLEMLQKDKRFKQLWRGSTPMDRGSPDGGRFQSVIFQKQF